VTLWRRRPWHVGPLAAIGLIGYATVAASFEPYTWPMRVATGAVCAAAAVDAVRHGWLRRWRQPPMPRRPRDVALLAVWLLLIGVVVGTQLAMYVSAPRDLYPTFSSVASDAFGLWPVRVAAFAVWTWAGWYLVRR
jgi:hypothetical protein